MDAMDSSVVSVLVESAKKQGAQPWPTCSFDEDFILVSEFSELVGPRPVMTVPEDSGASFNQNTFTVRIMSVDCTASMTNETNSNNVGSFRTVGDTQVVLVEPSEGAIAYVHHFTLYDITARGYVRPYCMAYVTNQSSKIMNNFSAFRDHFSRISAYFKYGNAVVFLQDLQSRLEYLKYAKRKMSENLNGKPIGTVCELPRDMKGFKFNDIETYEKDTMELKKIMFSFLKDDMFNEQKSRFSELLHGVVEEDLNTTDCIESLSLDALDEKLSSVEPWSLGISSGRKFDIQLRGLHELCSHSKEEAFGLMRNAYFYFGNVEFATKINSPRKPIHVGEPYSYKDYFKLSNSHTSNLSEEFFLNVTNRIHACHKGGVTTGSLPLGSGSSTGPSSVWTISSCPSRSNSYDMIKTSHGSSDDDYMSVKDTESERSMPASVISIGSAELNEYPTPLKTNPDCFPGTAKRVSTESSLSRKPSSPLKERGIFNLKYDESDSGTAENTNHVYWEDQEDLAEDKTKLMSNLPVRQVSIESNKSSSSSGSKSFKEKPKAGSAKVRTLSKSSIGSSSSKDSIPSPLIYFHAPTTGTGNVHGISLMALRNVYKFLPHLIYSLMIGRPVIIIADRINKGFVHSLVVSLLPCVPGYPKDKSSVIMWTKGPIFISNLATVKLVGLAKSRNRDVVSRSVLPYVSVLDFDKSTLTAPPYGGTYLLNCFDEQKEWPSEAVFRDFLRSAQLELSSQAFIMFSWLFSNRRSQQGKNHPVLEDKFLPLTMKVDAKSLMLSKFSPDDVKIIQYLMEILKSHLVGTYLKSISGNDDAYDEDCVSFACIDHASRLSHSDTPSVKLNFLKCQVFTNVAPLKKK